MSAAIVAAYHGTATTNAKSPKFYSVLKHSKTSITPRKEWKSTPKAVYSSRDATLMRSSIPTFKPVLKESNT